MAAARAHSFEAIMAQKGHHLRIVIVCGDHPALRVNPAADSDRSQRGLKKFPLVLEFIGHQETSSGCGLMGLGEKILTHYVVSHSQTLYQTLRLDKGLGTLRRTTCANRIWWACPRVK